MTTQNSLRRASALFCLTVVLFGCGRNGSGGGSETPTPKAEASALSTTSRPQTTTSPTATGDSRPERSRLAAPGAPRPRGGDAARAPGVPQPKKSNKRAPGAPIRIPARVEDNGRDLDEVLGEMRTGIRDQCGGTLCITLKVRYPESGDARCELLFDRTEPPQRSMVPRGSTVAVIAARQECETTTQTSDPSPETQDGSPSP